MSKLTRDGGKPNCGDVMNYSPPMGPKHIMNVGVGLRGGDNCGNAGSQGSYHERKETSGRPGLGGDNSGTNGTQGRR